MSTLLTWILGLAGLVGLTFGCVALHAPVMDADLETRTAAATAAFAGVSPQVDGRDVTLVGTVGSAAERAAALAASTTVRGVRVVRDGLTVAADAAVGTPAGAFGGLFAMRQGPGGVGVRGRLPDEAARASVLARLGSAFPGQAVTDEMTTDPAAPDWQGALQAVLPVLGGVAMPEVTIDGGTVVLRGRTTSVAEKTRIEADITGALPPGFALRSELEAGVVPNVTSATDQLVMSGDARLAGAEAALGEALGSGRIEFDSATARLTSGSREVLDRVVAVLERFPAVGADLKGYTDSEGDSRGNRTLSTRRAEATRDYLASKGIDAARLAPRGAGEADPVADNATEEGRARNRRVAFTLRQN